MRELVNLSNGDRLNLALQDSVLISKSIKNGKEKETKKDFENPKEAAKALNKKEWEALKKGYIIYNDDEKRLYIGGRYTGALAFEKFEGVFYVYKSTGQSAQLVCVNDKFEITSAHDLPKAVAWDMRGAKNLYLNLDHYIYKFDPKNAEFENLFETLKLKKGKFLSFLCAHADVVAFCMFGRVFLLKDGEFSEPFGDKFEIKQSQALLQAALSKDYLALHTKAKEVKIYDIKSGNLVASVSGKFGFLSRLGFGLGGEILLLLDMLDFKILAFDRDFKPLETKFDEAEDFCISEDGSLAAVRLRDRVSIYCLKTMEIKQNLTIKHIVKSCDMKFIGSNLAVRTDYGCFSLYEIKGI